MEVTMATGALFSLNHSHLAAPKPPCANSLSFRPKQGLICQASYFRGRARIPVPNEVNFPELLTKVSSNVSDFIKSAKGKCDKAPCSFSAVKDTIGKVGSCPLLPNLVKAFALGYIVWLGSRYVAHKKNQKELASQISELKELGHDEVVSR